MHCARRLEVLYAIEPGAALGICRPRQSATDEDYCLFGSLFTTLNIPSPAFSCDWTGPDE